MTIISFFIFAVATIVVLVWLRNQRAPRKVSIYLILGGIALFLLGVVSYLSIGEQSWEGFLSVTKITFSSRLVNIAYGFIISGILHFLITTVFPPDSPK